jgi:hypothetical protein
VRGVCDKLVQQRLMLAEDAERYITAAQKKNPFDPQVPLGPLLGVGG